MPVQYTVVSIGALSRNRLWGESRAVRTAHATTTLVTDDDTCLLVDPSLTGAIMGVRLHERTGRRLENVTGVFCTTLRQVHRSSVKALPHVPWYATEAEIDYQSRRLSAAMESAGRLGSEDQADIERDLAILERFQPAPEQFSPQIQLYPLPGPTPGGAGLLLTPATHTVVIAGDAAVTADHVMSGQVWQGSADTELAMESLRDILEIADVIIPGHDNLFVAARGMA